MPTPESPPENSTAPGPEKAPGPPEKAPGPPQKAAAPGKAAPKPNKPTKPAVTAEQLGGMIDETIAGRAELERARREQDKRERALADGLHLARQQRLIKLPATRSVNGTDYEITLDRVNDRARITTLARL